MSKNISQIVDRLRNEYGYKSDSETAEAIGMSKTALYNHKLRGTIPYEALYTFCEKKGISFDWLLTGDDPIERSPLPDRVSDAPASESYGDFVYVPQVTGDISAGGGLIPDNTVEMRIAFRKEWIERRGDPRNMSLIRVSGDSMEPTLVSGDLVLIDHGRNCIDPQGGIYAIALDDTIMIKRLQMVLATSRFKIISDNSRYDSAEVESDQVRINGRVIWFGRELER